MDRIPQYGVFGKGALPFDCTLLLKAMTPLSSLFVFFYGLKFGNFIDGLWNLMTQVSLIKMKAQGLPPGGEKGRTRRGNLTAVAESGRASGVGKKGQIDILLNTCEGRAGRLYNHPYRRK